jgi:hypothetical protein
LKKRKENKKSESIGPPSCPHTPAQVCVLMLLLYVTSYCYMCPDAYYMCPHTTMCRHTTISVLTHTTIYVSSYYYICPHNAMCPHTTICGCPHTAI